MKTDSQIECPFITVRRPSSSAALPHEHPVRDHLRSARDLLPGGDLRGALSAGQLLRPDQLEHQRLPEHALRAVADPGFWFGGGTFSHKLSTKNLKILKIYINKFSMKI